MSYLNYRRFVHQNRTAEVARKKIVATNYRSLKRAESDRLLRETDSYPTDLLSILIKAFLKS